MPGRSRLSGHPVALRPPPGPRPPFDLKGIGRSPWGALEPAFAVALGAPSSVVPAADDCCQRGRGLGPQLLWARCHRSRRPRPQLRHRALGRRVHLSVPILGVACPGAASQIPLPPVSCRGRRRLPLSSRPPPHHQAAPHAAGGEASPGQAPKDAPPNHSLRSCRSVSPPLLDTRRLASLRPPGPSAQRHRPHGSVDPPTSRSSARAINALRRPFRQRTSGRSSLKVRHDLRVLRFHVDRPKPQARGVGTTCL